MESNLKNMEFLLNKLLTSHQKRINRFGDTLDKILENNFDVTMEELRLFLHDFREIEISFDISLLDESFTLFSRERNTENKHKCYISFNEFVRNCGIGGLRVLALKD